MSLDCIASGTHLVPLARALVDTTGAVLELGSGDFSTPFLRRYCLAAGRELLSLENYPKWAAEFGVPCVDYDVAIPAAARREWSVVLVDHRPSERRIPDAIRFVGKTEYLLLHDYAHEIEGRPGVDVLTSAGSVTIDHDTLVLRR
jgi:hypothetical protein